VAARPILINAHFSASVSSGLQFLQFLGQEIAWRQFDDDETDEGDQHDHD
jgi:hypothetical protein